MVHQRILQFALQGLFDAHTEEVLFSLLDSIGELCTESVDTESWDAVITRMRSALVNFEKEFPELMVDLHSTVVTRVLCSLLPFAITKLISMFWTE